MCEKALCRFGHMLALPKPRRGRSQGLHPTARAQVSTHCESMALGKQVNLVYLGFIMCKVDAVTMPAGCCM